MKSILLKFLICLMALKPLLGFGQSRTDRDRYQLLRDKVTVENITNPLLRGITLPDVKIVASKDLYDTITDVDDFTNSTKGQDSITRANNIANFLERYNDVEYFVKGEVQVVIPIPGFSIGKVKLTPDIRGGWEVGGSFSFTARLQDFLTIAGAPSVGTSYAQLYLQNNYKYGLNVNYEFMNNWFGNLYLHNYNRRDLYEIVTASTIVNQDGDIIELDKDKNNVNAGTIDFKIGYKSEYFNNYFSIEELKISTFSENETIPLIFKIKPRFHYHLEYRFDLVALDILLFGGLMKRKSYNLDEGLYKGVKFDFNWLPIEFQVTLDNEYVTIQPRVDLMFFNADFTVKVPLNDTIKGFRAQTLWHAGIRLSYPF